VAVSRAGIPLNAADVLLSDSSSSSSELSANGGTAISWRGFSETRAGRLETTTRRTGDDADRFRLDFLCCGRSHECK
jgi:hypothetical protein